MLELKVTLAHSPDPDDAFMFYALAHGKVDTGGLTFTHEIHDIETLNRRAMESKESQESDGSKKSREFRDSTDSVNSIDSSYDVTALSFHAYGHPAIRQNYVLLTCGASVGDGYGPIIVSKWPLKAEGLSHLTVAVPGTLTTAFLALKLFAPGVEHRVVPFDKIPQAVAVGEVGAGVLIHEGQLNYGDYGLHKIIDLGQWWTRETGLPLPLGGNAVRRSLGPEVCSRVARLMKESIRYALAHREEALAYAMKYGRDLDKPRADRFVSMYVNDYTLDLGDRGKEAVRLLLEKGWEAGLISERVEPEFAEDKSI